MMFVPLLVDNDREVYVNPDHVLTIVGDERSTEVQLSNGYTLTVRQSLDEVLLLLDEVEYVDPDDEGF